MWGSIKNAVPAILTGVLLSFCFPRFHLSPLAFVALVPLLWRARTLSPLEAALHFFVAGFVFHVLLLQWLLANIMWAGGWAVLGQQLLCIVLALFWALAGGLWRLLNERRPAIGGPWTLAAFWIAIEHAQSTVFTGFGWSALGYSQGNNPYVLQWGAIGTVAIISFLIVLVNGLLANAIGQDRRAAISFVSAIVLLAATHGVGYLLLKPPQELVDPMRVGVLQSNFSLEMKWDREYRFETLRNASEKSIALARTADIDLMVWPEALILADLNSPEVDALLQRTVREGAFSLFEGAGILDNTRDYNSAILIDETGNRAGRYDKIHLAPFGEYVPLSEYLPFVNSLVPTIGNITPGTDVRILPVDGHNLGPLICFEMLFPPMSNRLRRENADFLTVITNLAWFGRSTAIPQELEISRMRAVETRLPLIHAANTGISGVFDPYGRFRPVELLAEDGPNLYPVRRDLPLDALVMARLVGAFDLAPKAPQPLIEVHRWLPWGIYSVAAALLAAGLLLPQSAPPPSAKKRPRRG